MEGNKEIVDRIERSVRERLGTDSRTPFLLGLCGAQGSGKSTIAASLAARFTDEGLPCAILSLDDLYKTKAEREVMARTLHPLFRTRGVPGTHDIGLAFAVLDALADGRAAPLPRFDKARDDRAPETGWEVAPADTRILILEGWCVGARPQEEAALAEPVNDLEREEDGEGIWRRAVNAALAGDYQRLFARLDLLAFLAAPSFGIVQHWRTEQEHKLRARQAGGMDDAAIARFVQHYERLTRHLLATMPAFADITFPLGEDRAIGPGAAVIEPSSNTKAAFTNGR